MTDGNLVRVQLPFHLQTLAQCKKEVQVKVADAVCVQSIVRALVARYPMLSGLIIDHNSGDRRPKIRFFACQEDYSLQALDTELPKAIKRGDEPLLIIGAISGG